MSMTREEARTQGQLASRDMWSTDELRNVSRELERGNIAGARHWAHKEAKACRVPPALRGHYANALFLELGAGRQSEPAELG